MKGIHAHLLEERANVVGCAQPTVKKGQLDIRDMRLRHAGMPNKTSNQVRVMLNQIFFADWYCCPMRIKLLKEAEPKIRVLEEESGVQIPVQYVDKLSHLTLKHTHDSGQDGQWEP